jgi:hypothetical protein
MDASGSFDIDRAEAARQAEDAMLTRFAAALVIGCALTGPVHAEDVRVGDWGAVKYGFGTLATACQASSALDRFHELRASDEMACRFHDGGKR